MGLVVVRPEGRLKTLRAMLRDLYPGAKVSARFSCLDKADLLSFEEATLGCVDDVAVLMSELIVGEMYLPSDASDGRDESEEEWFRLVEGFLGRPYPEFSAHRTQWERWRLL